MVNKKPAENKQTVLEEREGDIDSNNISIGWNYVAFLGYQDLIGNRRCGLKLSFQGSRDQERLSSKFFCIVFLVMYIIVYNNFWCSVLMF